ncbi:MAG: AraC family transcriptional regulator [Polyangiaceae bacterium]|nr:AraC family transcriptional regulator [Polyangiaceae bacterium]
MLPAFGDMPQVDLLADMAAFPLTAFPVKNHHPFGLHSHGSLVELVVVTHGSGKHLLEKGSFPIRPGDVFFVPAGLRHGYADCNQLGLVNAILDPARLDLPTLQLRRIPGYNALVSLEPELRCQHRFESRLHLEESVLREVVAQLWEMYQELLAKKPGYELVVLSLFTVLLSKLARKYAELTTPSSQGLTRLSELLEWLDLHYREPITIPDLLRRAHMTRSTLERHFHAAFGVAPWTYVRDLRLRKASLLLRNTDASVGEVAVQVGMKDANYFSRAFLKYTGLSPTEYRRRSEANAVVPSLSPG